jgi:DNA-binding transcriptional LysR family regulator
LSALEDLPHALDGLDAALLLAAPPWPKDWQVEVLAPETVGPVVSSGYNGWPKLKGKPACCLLDEPLLHTASRPQASNAWARAAKLPGAPPSGQGFPHLYYLLEAAIAGLGVAIVPAPLVADELAAGRLLAPWGFVATNAAWILALPDRRHDPRAPALAAWLANELAEDGPPRS